MFSSKAVRKIAEKKGDHVLVDLKLDERLKPLPAAAKYEQSGPRRLSSQRLASSLVNSSETYAIGSGKANDQIYYPGDLGLFGCVFEAWKNHWILRTQPDDWWFPVACRIAKAVDGAAKGRGSSAQKVRDLFVSHQGKENICVNLPVYSIYEANNDSFFSAMSSEIEQKIKVPDFARVMQNDFGTSGPAHKIASQINLMASMQEFFTFEMGLCGCGLRGLEMSGSVADWESLPAKLERVREVLKPIQDTTGLYKGWWDQILYVFSNLAKTRKNPQDPAVADFWINILMDTTGKKWVGGGGSFPGRPVEVKAYNGWLVRFLTDREQILAEDLQPGGSKGVREKLSGWNQVPMKVSLKYLNPPVEDMSTLVAGIVGFVLHKGDSEGDNPRPPVEEYKDEPSSPRPRKLAKLIGSFRAAAKDSGIEDEDPEVEPSVQPYHMWAMLLSPGSPLRR